MFASTHSFLHSFLQAHARLVQHLEVFVRIPQQLRDLVPVSLPTHSPAAVTKRFKITKMCKDENNTENNRQSRIKCRRLLLHVKRFPSKSVSRISDPMHGEWTIQVKFQPELKYLLVNMESHTNLYKNGRLCKGC